MIIITDGNGNLQAPTIPENVYQGSNNANSIIFLSPLPQSNSATIVFRLPNGLLTPEYLMTPFDDVPSKYELNAWVRDIDKDITALYGTVTYQIFLKNANGVVVASVAGTFNVLRGVAPLPATTPSTTSWNEILEYISQINSDIENGWLVSKGILPYDATFTYPFNATIYDKATNSIYISLKENNKGNPLTDTNSWSATTFVTTTDIQDIYTRLDEVEQKANNAEQQVGELSQQVGNLSDKVDGFETDLNNKVDKYVKTSIGEFETTISNNGAGGSMTTQIPAQTDAEEHYSSVSTLGGNVLLTSRKGNAGEVPIQSGSTILIDTEKATYTKPTGETSEIATKNDFGDYYNKEEVNTLIQNINAIQIRNKNNEAINATSATVQTIATQYIVDNYQRQPQNLDGLIITLTDQENDKVLYTYSETSNLWINVGINGVDLSNYVSLDQEQTITGNKNFTGNLQKSGKNVATVESDLSSLKDLNLTYGEETLTYDTTDGMTISATGQVNYGENNTKQTFDTEFNVPIVPADESITIDVNQTNNKFTIKGKNALITADSENNVSLCDIVQYNTTDGATFENLKVKNVNTEDTREATLNLTLPIIAGNNVTIDADETNSKLRISATGGSQVEIDNTSITKNTQEQIQTVGVMDETNNVNKVHSALTKQQFNELTEYDENTYYPVTDETGVDSIGGASGTITLGDGLSISNNVLSASGGSGGSDYIKEVYTDKTVAEMQTIIIAKQPDIIDLKSFNSSTRINIPITIYTENSGEWTETTSSINFADELQKSRFYKTYYGNDTIQYMSHISFNLSMRVFSSQIEAHFNGTTRVEQGDFSYNLDVSNSNSYDLPSSAVYEWTIYYKNEN